MKWIDGFLGFPLVFWAGLFASAVIFGFYAYAVASTPRDPMLGNRWSPLAITAGVFGRASLSNLQILYFSLIVFWVIFFVLLRDGTLVDLSEHVLYLLGIGAIGSGGAKVVAIRRQRLSFENWAWLKKKGWIKEDIGRSRRPPTWADLVNSDGVFDVFKFQSIVASLIIGSGLLIISAFGEKPDASLANFTIPEGLLGLLGLSQVTYVAGKVTAPAPVDELNQQLDKVRNLEGKFGDAVATAWRTTPPTTRDLESAKKAAAEAYMAFRVAADNALEMLSQRIGGRHATANVEPNIPA